MPSLPPPRHISTLPTPVTRNAAARKARPGKFGEEAGVFAGLRDEKLFREARVVLGAVTWPGDLDLAPDAMHREIKEHGRWIVG